MMMKSVLFALAASLLVADVHAEDVDCEDLDLVCDDECDKYFCCDEGLLADGDTCAEGTTECAGATECGVCCDIYDRRTRVNLARKFTPLDCSDASAKCTREQGKAWENNLVCRPVDTCTGVERAGFTQAMERRLAEKKLTGAQVNMLLDSKGTPEEAMGLLPEDVVAALD